MKYVFTGVYREFLGRVFANGQPVEITDRGTLELIQRDPSFKEYKDEETQGQTPDPAPVLKPKFDRSEWMKKMHAEGRMRK